MYLVCRVITGEYAGPVGFHIQVPTSRVAAVEVGPGDAGPVHVAESKFLRESGRSRGMELSVGLRVIGSWVIFLGVVLLR